MTPMILIAYGVAAAVFLIPAIVLWLWNLTMPDVFHLPQITYWQAFRLVLLAGLVVGIIHVNFAV